MQAKTIRELNQYNHRFYSQYGESFAHQREYFWPSWSRFLQLSVVLKNTRSVNVADVGCGSGRFALFLHQQLSLPFSYIGCDVSEELLAVAHRQLQDTVLPHRLYQTDIVEELLEDTFSLPGEPHIIALFGVLHHIPDHGLRKQFLRSLIYSLPSSGELWLTLWNPRRTGVREPAEKQQFSSSGDVLVGWQGEPNAERYVHWISEEEETDLLSSLPQSRVVSKWVQDSRGERGNICLLIQKI